LSAQNPRPKLKPAFGIVGGLGNRRSISRRIICVSQKMSAPICITGVLRYPPVSGVRSGFGIMFGISTDRHVSPFIPNTTRTFSENGEVG
jgi:hypothetical protein